MKITKKGFTLIELLVVIGILAILLAITLIAINPARQFQQSNNTKRRSDVNAILNAISQYQTENKGSLPTGITSSAQVIGTGVGKSDICSSIVPRFIAALPVDPLQVPFTGATAGSPVTDCTVAGGYTTNYTVLQGASDNRVTVAAPGAELSETISVTR